jgi:hypothetical protein
VPLTEESELGHVIRRIVSRILTAPASAELLESMRAYGSPERFLIWWLHGMSGDFASYARTLTNKEIAEPLDYNAADAKSDMARAIMQEAARRLKDDCDPQFVEPHPPDNPTLKAYAQP